MSVKLQITLIRSVVCFLVISYILITVIPSFFIPRNISNAENSTNIKVLKEANGLNREVYSLHIEGFNLETYLKMQFYCTLYKILIREGASNYISANSFKSEEGAIFKILDSKNLKVVYERQL